MVYYREIMVDRDALCPINVMSFKFNQLLTNLGPKSVDFIFYAPNVANLRFWRIVPTIALYYREKLGPRISRGCF